MGSEMCIRDRRQPTKAARLNHRQIKVRRLGISDLFTFLLNKESQTKVVKLGHDAHLSELTLAVVNDLATPPDVALATGRKARDGAGGTRTHDLRFRKPLLYPAELQPQIDQLCQRGMMRAESRRGGCN